ncbi:MAG: UbiA family prenyltransferase [Gemmatimonadetes bacterium]|nr:UbiA family prenyltransferase [Gemmatimonadota bacterium]
MKLLDLFFLLRPIVLIPSWAFLLAGVLRASESSGQVPPPLGELWLPLLLFTMSLAGSYVVNQIYDADSDRENGKLFLISEGHVTTGAAWIMAIALLAGSVAGSLVFDRTVLPWTLLAAVIGLLYSADPARLKARPLLDLLANATGYGLVAFLFGYSRVAPVSPDTLVLSVPYMLLVAAVFVHTTVVDRPGDEKAGLRTTAVLLGDRNTSWFGLALLAGALGAGWTLGEPYPAVAAFGAIAFFLLSVIDPGVKGSTLSYQWGSLVFVILIIIRMPLFGALLVLLVLLTRLYYRFRFGMKYPKLDF